MPEAFTHFLIQWYQFVKRSIQVIQVTIKYPLDLIKCNQYTFFLNPFSDQCERAILQDKTITSVTEIYHNCGIVPITSVVMKTG